jgi:hydrogenase maturation protease
LTQPLNTGRYYQRGRALARPGFLGGEFTLTVSSNPARCLILACGNTLRSDDGVGLRLAEWAEERFQENDNVRIVARQQWTPDLAEEIAAAESVLFVDSSIKSLPGHVCLVPVEPCAHPYGAATHRLDPDELLRLTHELYGSRSAHSMLLTVGAGSTEMGEALSDSVQAALPRARGVLEKTVLRFLEN